MTEERRRECTAVEYIRELYRETKNGRVKFFRDIYTEDPHTVSHEMDWSEEIAEDTVRRFELLEPALRRIGEAGLKESTDDEECRRLLSAEDFEVWSTYIKAFEDSGYDKSVIESIIDRMEGDLFPEEEEIWKNYCIRIEEQSQKRLPFRRRLGLNIISGARQYVHLVRNNAPELILLESSRLLAEEMVLYYGAKEAPLMWE